MSQAAWFRQKADECARQAENASELNRRGDYAMQAEHWRQMAERIEANDRNRLGQTQNDGGGVSVSSRNNQ
jgi:hypothetical protein